MFSKSCEYAIKALIFVSKKSIGGRRVSIIEISQGTEAPIHFVAKIMQELSRRRLVLSVKGPHGGFFMTDKENETSLSEIVKVFEGDKLFTDCIMGLKPCAEKTFCPLHAQYQMIRSSLIDLIESNKIGNLQNRIILKDFFEPVKELNFL